MTPRMTSLIADAKRAGYRVTTKGTTTVILKLVGRWNRPHGLLIYDDGTAIDVSVEHLDVAKGLRSYKDMRAVLHLQPEGTDR
jgi:hypothetical protein